MPRRGKLQKHAPHHPGRKKAIRQGFAQLFGQAPMSGDDDDQGPSCLPAVTSGTKLRKMKAKNSDVNPITKKTGGDEEDAGELLNKWCPQAATMEHIKRYTAMHEGVRSAPIDERPGELLRRAGVAHADVIGPLLDQVLSTYSLADARLVGKAQAEVNSYNRRSLKERDPDASVFRPNGQDFRGSGPVSIMGGYPTSSVLDGPAQDKLLGDQGNATVQTLSMLMGLPRGADLGDGHLLSNRIFTTLRGKYTEVPNQSHYGMFHPGLVEYRTNLLAGGVKVFVEVTRSNLGSLEEALRDGPTEPLRRYELLHVNGTSLELLATPQGDAVLVVLPHEHLSHVLWSELNEAGRLQLLLGFHAVFGVLAALLGRRRPRIDNLLTAVKAKTLRPTGIVAGSGAYMEACMRSKLFVFIAVHGDTEGRARWHNWYTECKSRGGTAAIETRKANMDTYLQECADGGKADFQEGEKKADGTMSRGTRKRKAEGGRTGGAASTGVNPEARGPKGPTGGGWDGQQDRMEPYRFPAGHKVKIKGKEVALPRFTLRCDARHKTLLSFLVETGGSVIAEERYCSSSSCTAVAKLAAGDKATLKAADIDALSQATCQRRKRGNKLILRRDLASG